METPLNPAGRHITGRVKSEVRVADGREVLAGTNATANAVDVAINSTRYTDIGKQKYHEKKKQYFIFQSCLGHRIVDCYFYSSSLGISSLFCRATQCIRVIEIPQL